MAKIRKLVCSGKYSKVHLINKSTSKSPKNILFIPGGPGMYSDCFIPFARKYLKQNNVYVYDLEKPAQPGHEFISWGKDLLETCKKIRFDVVIGHSFGGMIKL